MLPLNVVPIDVTKPYLLNNQIPLVHRSVSANAHENYLLVMSI